MKPSKVIKLTEFDLANANQVLKATTRLLFGVAIGGQLLFLIYIISFYGATVMERTYEKWNEVMHNGFIAGDVVGNFFLVLHIFLAAIITLGGPLQFIPQLRTHFPSFHKRNGRIYILTAFLISIAGLYMVHTRGVIGGNLMALGNTINASLIMIFSVLTWRTAIKKEFIKHRRWALRTFLVVSGVWFFRVGFGLWIFLNGGSAPGSTEQLTGPFDQFLAIARALLPLAMLELYFFAKKNTGKLGKFIMAGSLVVLTILLGAGIFMAAMIFWI